MKVKIEINCDNAVFFERGIDDAIATCLRTLARRINDRGLYSISKVMDVNGNSVGTVETWDN